MSSKQRWNRSIARVVVVTAIVVLSTQFHSVRADLDHPPEVPESTELQGIRQQLARIAEALEQRSRADTAAIRARAIRDVEETIALLDREWRDTEEARAEAIEQIRKLQYDRRRASERLERPEDTGTTTEQLMRWIGHLDLDIARLEDEVKYLENRQQQIRQSLSSRAAHLKQLEGQDDDVSFVGRNAS